MRRVTARYTWDRLRVSFWFAPTVMSVAAVLVAWTLYWVDGLVPNQLLDSSRLFLSGTAGESRSALLAMAASTLTTAGVVFTLLTLPLSTVAAQYGSRLLRVFLGDRTTQLVLGMFAATFVYCIAAALSIPPATIAPDAPQITPTFGLVLMLATFASLILLVQHISTMLQAPNIAASAGAELRELVIAEFPEETHNADRKRQAAVDQKANLPVDEAYMINAWATGYIQAVDPAYLLAFAQELDLVVRLVEMPGAFVTSGETVALIWPRDRVTERLEEQVRKAIRLGNQRTPNQDVECAVNQLVEMAVRAMSPAINDPFTAMTCLDHLGDGLALFVQQGGEDLYTFDELGHLRLIFEPTTLDKLLDAAFGMLRHASCDNAFVLLHMLDVIDAIGRKARAQQARLSLITHVDMILAESLKGALTEHDLQRIRLRAHALQQELAAEWSQSSTPALDALKRAARTHTTPAGI